jgi:integrase
MRTLGAVPSVPRQRTLSLEELQALLTVLDAPCQKDAKVGRLALRVLLLTGKRCGETLRARWDELDLKDGTWRIPGANRKATKQAALGDEIVPLSPPAVVAFKALLELRRGESPWAFGSPHSAARGRLADTAPSRIVKELFKARTLKGEEWTPHDLRRTARSYWSSKLKVPWHVSELLLGHALPKVARTYDVGDYLDERRDALNRWAVYLDQVQAGDGKVMVLPVGGVR